MRGGEFEIPGKEQGPAIPLLEQKTGDTGYCFLLI